MTANNAQDQLDTRAIEIAKEALTKIDAHEKMSNMIHQRIENAIDNLFNEIRSQNKRWLFVSGSVILGLLSIVGFLLVKVLSL